MSPATVRLIRTVTGFPRVSGDEPRTHIDTRVGPLFSPRERG